MGNMIQGFKDAHPKLIGFFQKVGKDNIGMLASVVAWSTLTSLVPIVVGLIAISALLMRSPSAQATVTAHLSQALRGVITPTELKALVKASVRHTGLLGIIGFVGVLWGGSNVGGSISTVFQALFEVRGRSFIKQRLLDIGMIFVFAILMIVIIVGTAGGALLNRLVSGFPLPGIVTFVIGTAISLLAAFLLFAVIYIVFPNTETRFKLDHVWPGAAIAAVLFEILTYIWPLYSHFTHFSRYGALLSSILVLTAWIYFFSMIMMVGAEFVSFGALEEARARDESVGPRPNDSVPQRTGMRGQRSSKSRAS